VIPENFDQSCPAFQGHSLQLQPTGIIVLIVFHSFYGPMSCGSCVILQHTCI